MNTYDDVPYDSHPFPQTHPSRLFTVGTLFGLRPTPVQRCRVLELGCASGGNIIPMGEAFPDSEFLAVDLSERQIQEGKELIRELGIKNVDLRHMSFADIDESFGKFDYIICHGVFSWVTQDLRNRILDICQKHLTPNGIAYVSYNTYPGWHMRGMIRDMMRYHASRFTTAQLRIQQARALLDFLAQSVRQDGGAYATLLKQELESIRHQADSYLYHEHLEEKNDPLYFHEFVEGARRVGLRYLGEARVGTMVTGNFGPEIEKTLKMLATDQIQVEQYMDFLRNRMFRESLLCHEAQMPVWGVNPESLRLLHVASVAKPVGTDGQPLKEVNLQSNDSINYKTPSGMSMATPRPLLKAAMSLLGEAWPGTVPFDVLRTRARERIGGEAAPDDLQVLAVGLLNCYMGSDLVELHGSPITIVRAVSEKPEVTKLALLQSRKRPSVTNRRHEIVRLDDLNRHIVPLLDGTHDREMLVTALTKLTLAGSMNIQKDGAPIRDEAEIMGALRSVIGQALTNLVNLSILAK